MNIYYFGADQPWQELQITGFRRRNTCLLKAFAESHLTDSIYVVRKVSRKEYLKNLLSKRKKNSVKVHDVVFTTLIPEILLVNKTLELLNKKISAALLRRECEPEKEDDIIWAYWPQGFKNALDAGIEGTYVFDADHNIIDDPNVPVSEKPAREKLLLSIGRKADYILSSVRSMLEWYNKYDIRKGVRLRNGVDAERFNTAGKAKQNDKFTVGYCGILSKWIDYDIFSALAIRNPEWRFIVIGKPFLNNDWKILQNYSNIELLGEKSSSEVAAIIPTFDAAINLYRTHPALDVDSMKLYEYIAAGVPVVSTNFHPYLKEDFHDILFLGDTLEAIEAHLKRISSFGVESRQEKVQFFLENSSWYSRVNHFLQSISTSN